MRTHPACIAEMSKSEIRELESRLSVIIEHLLKITYVAGQAGLDNLRGWKKSARDQQNELVDHIEENPGLKAKITETFLDTVYRSVVGGLNKDYPGIRFPRTRQLSLEEIVGAEVMMLLRKK
jgi:hypothetical protein